jgi:hypothetical protein
MKLKLKIKPHPILFYEDIILDRLYNFDCKKNRIKKRQIKVNKCNAAINIRGYYIL